MRDGRAFMVLIMAAALLPWRVGAAEEARVPVVGASVIDIVRTFGAPMMKARRQQVVIFYYENGELAIRNGRVIAVSWNGVVQTLADAAKASTPLPREPLAAKQAALPAPKARPEPASAPAVVPVPPTLALVPVDEPAIKMEQQPRVVAITAPVVAPRVPLAVRELAPPVSETRQEPAAFMPDAVAAPARQPQLRPELMLDVTRSLGPVEPLTDRETIMEALRLGEGQRVVPALQRIRGPEFAEAVALLVDLFENVATYRVAKTYPDGHRAVGLTTIATMAAEALGRIGPAAVDPVRETLVTGNPKQRFHAALAAALLHSAGHFADAWDLIVASFHADDNEPEVVAAYIRRHAQLSHPLMTEAIAAKVHADEPVVVSEVCRAMAQLEYGPRVALLLDVYATHEEQDCSEAAAAALREIASPDAVPPLLALLQNPEWLRKKETARLLGTIGGGDVERALLQLLVSPSSDARRIALHGLDAVRDVSRIVLPVAQVYLNDRDAECSNLARRWLLQRVEGLASDRLADLLLPRYMRGRGAERTEALELILRNASTERGTRIVIMGAMAGEDAATRRMILGHIGRFPAETARPVLERALVDPEPALRVAAVSHIEAAASLDADLKRALLHKVALSEDIGTAPEAALALGRLNSMGNDARIVDVLLRLVNEGQPEQQRQAMAILSAEAADVGQNRR